MEVQIKSGINHSSFYYFNKGPLNANEITKQFLDVLIAYESIGVKINGLVCDGGGTNESFLHKVVDSFNLDDKFPSNKSIKMIHPLDDTRRIFVQSRGTHSLKAVRNNLFRSKHDGTRHLKLNKTHYGWKDFESIYHRDEDRVKIKELRRTTATKEIFSLN